MVEKKEKIIIVLPAYNAVATLKKTIDDIPKNFVDEIILVDDCSKDNTVYIAKELGLIVFKHEKNKGYGGNQKTCYTEALKRNPDIVIMVHPDYQYDTRILEAFILPIRLDICDIMLGNRIRTRKEALKGGMPLYKYIANRFLTFIENTVTGQNLGEFHSGLRAYKRDVLEKIPFLKNSNDFLFDSEFLILAIYFGYRIGDFPVPTRYIAEVSSISFLRSVKYGLLTLWTVFKFILAKLGIRTKIFKR
jgi:glycosyltransferase involved in cell wall biosynthesis